MLNLKKKGRVNFLWLYLMANLSVCLSVSLFLTLSLSHMHVHARAHTHTHTLAGSVTPEPVWSQYGWEFGKARKVQRVPESPKNCGVAKS